MGKQKYLVAFLIILVHSCATFKKAQVKKDSTSLTDTTQIQKVVEVIKVDSMAIVKNWVQSISASKLDFKTMNARVKVEYETSKSSESYIANLSILKDSQIYITIRGAMGVIGIKALIKKDSVVILYPLNKTKSIERKPISYLQEVVKIPFTFSTIQDLLIGQPVFLDTSQIDSFQSLNDLFQVNLIGKLFKNLILLNNDHTKVLKLILEDKDPNMLRNCAITYSNHVQVGDAFFPLNRNLMITAQNKLDIIIEVKEYSFNDPLKYTFALPKINKRK